MTYEPLGINGAQASIVFDWNETTLRSNIERRDPALIVLAYGTNEAGRRDITLESYRAMFSELIAKIPLEPPPAATILVVGPPDRDARTRKGWEPLDTLDIIVEAQREAAAAQGCPFWDLRAKMGGKGSMQQWVNARHGPLRSRALHGARLSDAERRDLPRFDEPGKQRVPQSARGHPGCGTIGVGSSFLRPHRIRAAITGESEADKGAK